MAVSLGKDKLKKISIKKELEEKVIENLSVEKNESKEIVTNNDKTDYLDIINKLLDQKDRESNVFSNILNKLTSVLDRKEVKTTPIVVQQNDKVVELLSQSIKEQTQTMKEQNELLKQKNEMSFIFEIEKDANGNYDKIYVMPKS